MKKVAAMLKRRFENIITYLTHTITNATSESINAKSSAQNTRREDSTINRTSLMRLTSTAEIWNWHLHPLSSQKRHK